MTVVPVLIQHMREADMCACCDGERGQSKMDRGEKTFHDVKT